MNRKEIILEFLSDEKYPPVNAEEIMLMLDIPFDDREELMEILSGLTMEGRIIKTSKKKYASPEKLGFVKGKVSIARGGFGFLLMDKEDVFIKKSNLLSAMNGDIVLVEILKSKKAEGKPEGKVVRILKRTTDTIVGTFKASRNFGFVIPDDEKFGYDVFIKKTKTLSAKDGQKVVVHITKWPENDKKPEGEVKEILGFPHKKGVDILSVMRSYGLYEEFNEKVERQCESIFEGITDADISERFDFRKTDVITIDGVDSKDFDDAVSVEFEGGIYILYVHIADVTHYVTQDSPLDKEALKRGTSVYFPGSVIPMLPKKLSNGICSLNPHEDRLTLSVIMKINEAGEVIDHKITEGIICSKERMTYDDVTKILEGDKNLTKKYSHIYEMLLNMKALCEILRKKRLSQGSIDFDFPETKIITDENGKAVDVYKYRQGVSNKIIEEFMLIANKTVAEEFFWAEIPFVYRIHEKPSKEKICAFNDFSKNMGYKLPTAKDPHPGEFAKIIDKIKGTREELMIAKTMLRSLMKAKYSENCLGHFGLAFKYYCHFTSPIRRYPDLAIHRIIKEFIKYGLDEKRIRYYKKFVADAALKSSEAELTAMEAQREAEDIKKAEYMKEHIGEEFDAVVSSVTSFGMFCELENGIEGLIRLSSLNDDYYIYDEISLSLIGEHTGKCYRIGDSIRIVVANASWENGTIDFDLTT